MSESITKEPVQDKKVDPKIFALLRKEYYDRFDGSPSKVLKALNELKDKDVSSRSIGDRTLRNFFNAKKLPNTSLNTLNCLCKLMLKCESYGEALRSQGSEDAITTPVLSLHQDKKNTPNHRVEESLEDRLQPYYEKTKRKLNQLKILDMREVLSLIDIYTDTYFLVKPNYSTLGSDYNFARSSDIINSSQKKRISALEKIKKCPYLMILGGPGAGKTSFLKSTGLRYLDKNKSIQDFGKWYIPIYISIKVLGQAIDRNGLQAVISDRFADIFNPEEVENMLKEGKFLILLDALDEYNNFISICDKIEEFLDKYDDNRFIVTTRLGMPESKIAQFDEVRIADFSQEQISNFVKNWFEFSEKRDKEEGLDLSDDLTATELTKKFLDDLKENSAISQLSTNPLTLTYLCLRFKVEFGFPKNLSGLLRDVVNILLRRWDATRRIARIPKNADKLSDDRKIEIFGIIAFKGLTKEKDMQLLWQEQELQNEIREYLKKVSTINHEEINDITNMVLQVLIRDHGLLIPQTDTRHSFPHVIFQQYFVAEHIQSKFGNDNLFVRITLKKYLFDRQWEQVFLMLSEKLNNTDDLFRQMFWNINLLLNGKHHLTKMLEWMHKITKEFKVDSSAWRSFILATDLEADLYFKRCDIDVNYSYAHELSIQTVKFNQKRKRITPNQPKFIVALYLVIIYDLALERIEEKLAKLKDASAYTKDELAFDLDTTIGEEFDLAIAQAQQIEDMPNLIENLQQLQSEIPSDTDSAEIWQPWAEKLHLILDDL